MSIDYFGYIYIWFDTKRNIFYIGSHKGKIEDSYICSSKRMLTAYKKRPNTFRFRVLEYVYKNSLESLKRSEQNWLNMINDSELMTSNNIKNNTYRYYNMKKDAYGGSYKGHSKNRKKPAWNRGVTQEMIDLRRNNLFCFMNDKPKPKLKNNKPKPKLKQDIIKYKKPKKVRVTYIKYNICPNCKNTYIVREKSKKKFCSVSCNSKFQMNFAGGKEHLSQIKKGKQAWNRGLHNPKASNNGKIGAKKQSEKVKGRKREYRNDGSWFWVYPNQN